MYQVVSQVTFLGAPAQIEQMANMIAYVEPDKIFRRLSASEPDVSIDHHLREPASSNRRRIDTSRCSFTSKETFDKRERSKSMSSELPEPSLRCFSTLLTFTDSLQGAGRRQGRKPDLDRQDQSMAAALGGQAGPSPAESVVSRSAAVCMRNWRAGVISFH